MSVSASRILHRYPLKEATDLVVVVENQENSYNPHHTLSEGKMHLDGEFQAAIPA